MSTESRCRACDGFGGWMEDWDKGNPCLRCDATGIEPTYEVVPWEKLTTWQQFRARYSREGVYMRSQYGDTYYDRDIGSPGYRR